MSGLVCLSCLLKGGHPDSSGRRGDFTFSHPEKKKDELLNRLGQLPGDLPGLAVEGRRLPREKDPDPAIRRLSLYPEKFFDRKGINGTPGIVILAVGIVDVQKALALENIGINYGYAVNHNQKASLCGIEYSAKAPGALYAVPTLPGTSRRRTSS